MRVKLQINNPTSTTFKLGVRADTDQASNDESVGFDNFLVQSTRAEADLVLTKVADDSTPVEGQDVVYTLTVENKGPCDITNATILDNLPAGVTVDSVGTPSHGVIVP